jgi:hypothetical protein
VNEEQAGMRSLAPIGSMVTGKYSFDDPVQERLGRKLDQLTGGNKDTRVVVFCFYAHCSLSYNVSLCVVMHRITQARAHPNFSVDLRFEV